MSDLENLKAALKKWREGVRISNSETSRVSPKNPYGPAIHALNMEWAETRRANDERIRQERERYEAKRKELAEASEAWKREYGGRQDGRGRPKNPEYSDEVKIAAARLFRSSGSKTIVRSALVFRDTAHLNSVLEEGKALLQAQEDSEW